MDNSFRKLDSEMEKRRRKDQKVVGLEQCFSSFFFFFGHSSSSSSCYFLPGLA